MASVRSGTFIGPMAASVRSGTFIGPMAPNRLVVGNPSSDAVGDPSLAFTKNDLQKLFSEVGRLESVELDSSNRGVIIFCSSKDATEAMYQLNKTELKGKPMIITWCEKQCPCSDAKLFVSFNGPLNNDMLKASFSDFGAIDSFEVELQHPDASYGTVQFDSETSAANAIKFFNNAENHGPKFLVSKYNDCNARGIVTQAVTEDNNPEEVPIFVTEDNKPEEVPIIVNEGNRKQVVATVNMEDFPTIPDLLQRLNELWEVHNNSGLLEEISLARPWPGYKVVYSHVDSKNKEVINPWEDVAPLFNEDPFKSFELWFLSMVNNIEFSKI